MKIKLLKLVILISFINSYMYGQDIVMSVPDSGLKSITVSAKNIIIPKQLQAYSGIRFADVRYLKDFIGFIPSANGKNLHKLIPNKSFEEELNDVKRSDEPTSVSSDSIIVVIRNFWFNKNVNEKHGVYCHVSALFFIKRKADVFYDFKVDSFFKYRDPFGDFYKICIDKVISDLISLYTEPGKQQAKKYTFEELNFNIQKKRTGFKPIFDSMGVFFTFKDFINGNLFKTELVINPFFDQFTFNIKDEQQNIKLHKEMWGLMYKGILFIRNDNYLSKAFATEGTYLTRSNLEIQNAGFGNADPADQVIGNNKINPDVQAVRALSSAAILNLLRHKKARIKSYPMILNLESGELE